MQKISQSYSTHSLIRDYLPLKRTSRSGNLTQYDSEDTFGTILTIIGLPRLVTTYVHTD